MTPPRAFAGATILGTVVVFFHAAVAQTGSSPAYFLYPPGVIPADLDQEIQRVQGEVDQWHEPSEILVLALAPSVVQHAAHECTGAGPLELRNQRAIRDAQLLHLGLALQAELAAGCPGGRLYGEALATALAVRPPQLRAYRGGLPQVHLRRVLEYMQAHLDQELSLVTLAAVSDALGFPHQSHFATTFRTLVGMTPRTYQRQRGER